MDLFLTKKVFFLIPVLFLFACSKDDVVDKRCSDITGRLEASVNKDFKYISKYTNFSNYQKNRIEIKAEEVTDDCIILGGLYFMIEKRLGNHELSRTESLAAREIGETVFLEWDEDVILGRFLLSEEEPNNLKILSMTEDTIKGNFTATYIHRESQNDVTNIPDTLRFKNVDFTAVLSEYDK